MKKGVKKGKEMIKEGGIERRKAQKEIGKEF